MQDLLIIPTYNESENIKDILVRVSELYPNLLIWVVDDNSPDGTGNIVRKFSANNPKISLFTRKEKTGLGDAYKFILEKVQERNDIRNVVTMDADGSHDPLEIGELIDALEKYDFAVGSRYVRDGKVQGWDRKRLLLSYFGNIYSRIITGLPIKDGTAGFIAFRSKVLKSIDLSVISSSGYAYQIEFKLALIRKGNSYCEVPITFSERRLGKSKMSGQIILEGLLMPWRILLKKHKIFFYLSVFAVFAHLIVFFVLLSLSRGHPNSLHSTFPVAGGGWDSFEYATLGDNILHYSNFSMKNGSNGSPETFRTPAYPFVVAIIIAMTGSIETVPIFQIIFLIISGYLLYLIAVTISSEYKNIGLVAVGLFFFDPTLFFTTQFVTTESFYLLMFLACVYCLIRGGYSKTSYALAGLFFGITVLTRPSGLLMIIPVGLFIVWKLYKTQRKDKYFTQIILFACLFVVAVLPWYLRNGYRTGVYKLSSVDAYNALNFNTPQFFEYKFGVSIETTRERLFAKIGNISEFEQRQINNSAIMKKVVWQEMRPYLFDYALFHISKTANFFLSSGLKFDKSFLDGFWNPQPTESWHPKTSLVNSLLDGRIMDVLAWVYKNVQYIPESIFLVVIMVSGLYFVIKKKSSESWFIFALIIFLALVTGQLSNPRYRIPVIPFMYICGVAGLSLLVSKYENYKRSKYSMLEILKKLVQKIPIDLGQGSFHHKTKGKRIALSLVPDVIEGNKPTALDLGCNDGYYSDILKAKGYNVTSIDISKNYGPVQIVDANKRLPFADNSFDLVWSSEVIEHLIDPIFTISEVRRVLKPNGKALFTTPNSHFWIYWFLDKLFGITPKQAQNQPHLQFFGESDIRKFSPKAVYGYFPYFILKFKITKLLNLLTPTFIFDIRKN